MLNQLREMANRNAAAGGAAVIIIIAVLVGTLGSQVYEMNAEPQALRLLRPMMCADCEHHSVEEVAELPAECPQCGKETFWAAMVCSKCEKISPADLTTKAFASDLPAPCPRCNEGILVPIPPTDAPSDK